VLEARDLPVGVVSAIAGQERHQLTFTGEAAHAGTTPMDKRHDALAAAAIFVQAVEGYAESYEGLVATVGQLVVKPGAANVVPGEVTLSLDVRHADDSDRVIASRNLLAIATQIAKHRMIGVTATQISADATVPCSKRLVSTLSRAVQNLGHPLVELASGAGHDAVAMSALTEVGMLFVRCKGGVSHNPAESVTTEDVAVAIDVLSQFLELVAQE
jgi:allantoate deiminase